MNIIVDIILRRFIIRFIGVHVRYFFLKLIGKEKSLVYLRGEESEEPTTLVIQDFFNAIVGFCVFAIISIGIAYLWYSVF